MTTENTQGTVLTDAELNQLREKIRMEERSKLATRITQLETVETEFHNTKARLVEAETKLAQMTEELDVLRKSLKTDKDLDVPRLIDEVRRNAVAGLQADTEQRIASLSQQLAQMQAENRRLAVESYKARRIAEEQAAGNKFIVELVAGTTEQEIDASIVRSKEVFNRTFNTASAAAGAAPAGAPPSGPGASAPAGARGPTPVATPATGDAAAPAPSGSAGRSVAEMVGEIRNKKDRAAFAASRADLKAAVAEEFRQTGTNVATR